MYLIPGGVGGTEIYLRNLLRALAQIDSGNTYFVFTNQETDSDLVPAAPNFHQVCQSVAATNRPMRLIWEQTLLPEHARRLSIDCLLNPGFTAPAISSCANVTVFHDLQHKRHPEHFRKLDRPAWDFFLWLAVRRSRIVLADSEATGIDLARYYGLVPGKIRVAPLGVEDEFFRIGEMRGELRPYILCASTLHPHKNIERLVRVFAGFRKTHPEFTLVLAGMRGFRASVVETLIADLYLTDCVRVTGWLPRADLYDLFRYATAFVYPSTFEGFGLPVVEAMAAGIPLACSNIEPLRSIVRDTALTFDPFDEDTMMNALHRLVTSPPSVEPARQRARDFTWSRCAEITLNAIRDAALRRG